VRVVSVVRFEQIGATAPQVGGVARTKPVLGPFRCPLAAAGQAEISSTAHACGERDRAPRQVGNIRAPGRLLTRDCAFTRGEFGRTDGELGAIESAALDGNDRAAPADVGGGGDAG